MTSAILSLLAVILAPPLALPAGAADCVVGATCVANVCIGGTLTRCEPDPVACTSDVCDPVRGCLHAPLDVLCEDGDPCTRGTCDPIHGCRQTPVDGPVCNDGDGCTTGDRCAAGRCVGEPVRCPPDDSACTDEVCVRGRGCVSTPRPNGEPCPDDGLSCTDDVCYAGDCFHVPIDSRCEAPGTCSDPACAPERADADPAGCIAGSRPSVDGAPCAEDGDPCSEDRCTAQRCAHVEIPEARHCAGIRRAYRQALALTALARALAASIELQMPARPSARAVTTFTAARLRRCEADLAAALRALAGHTAPAPRPGGTAETVTQRRARAAFLAVRRTPPYLRAVVRAARRRHVRNALGDAHAALLARRGRELLRGTESLRDDLDALQGVVGTFAR